MLDRFLTSMMGAGSLSLKYGLMRLAATMSTYYAANFAARLLLLGRAVSRKASTAAPGVVEGA